MISIGSAERHCDTFLSKRSGCFSASRPIPGKDLIIELDDGCHIAAKKKSKRVIKRRTIQIDVPDDWETNKDWLDSQYPGKVGLLALARAIGCSKAKLYRIMGDMEISISSHKKSVRSGNKHYNRKWVTEHYVDKRMPLRDCAELAGINATTFRQWLTHFDIPTRSLYEMNQCRPSGSDGSIIS